MKRIYGWKIREYVTRTNYFDGVETEYTRIQSFGFKYKLWVFSWWFVPLYEEEVPSFAWIQENTMGFTDWKSKIPQWCHDIKTKF